MWRDLVEGFRYVRNRPRVSSLLLLSGVNSFFGAPYFTMVPIYARDIFHLGETGLALMMGTAGAGLFSARCWWLISATSEGKAGLCLAAPSCLALCIMGFALSSRLTLVVTVPVWPGFCPRGFRRNHQHAAAKARHGSDAGPRDEHVYPFVYGHDADWEHTRRHCIQPFRPAASRWRSAACGDAGLRPESRSSTNACAICTSTTPSRVKEAQETPKGAVLFQPAVNVQFWRLLCIANHTDAAFTPRFVLSAVWPSSPAPRESSFPGLAGAARSHAPRTRSPLPRALPIKSIKIDTKISSQVATTHVEQVFRNDTGATLEGTYLFPIPESASIAEFAIWEGDRRLVGEVRTREEARRIYDEIVRRQRDPGLLEYAGKDLFQASIFPILPHSDKKLEITYTQVVRAEGGTVSYRYPLGIGRQLTQIDSVAGRVEVESKEPLRNVYSPTHVDRRQARQRKALAGFV